MTEIRHHLEVVAGADKGELVAIKERGSSFLGRASDNDISLRDPLLSRRHCRFYFQPGDGLWVEDLDSANQTMVNDKPVTALRLHPGDRLIVGESVLSVLDDQPATAPSLAGGPATGDDNAPPPVVDLGFDSDSSPEAADLTAARSAARLSARSWWLFGGVVGGLLVLALLLRLLLPMDDEAAGVVRAVDQPTPTPAIDLRYEKIDATPENIFRYEFILSPDNVLSVRIDDLARRRHVSKSRKVEEDLVRELVEAIRRSGFFTLDPRYEGLSDNGEKTVFDIEIILGRNAHRTVVRNRIEPPAFKTVRERIETFSKNELGLWALQYPRERLIEMAHDSLLLARKLFEERDVAQGNLAESVKRFREAEFYLETVDPKPDFFPRIVSGLREALELLDQRYSEYRFRADRALNLQDWERAAAELRILMELIPDRRDERHQEAHRKLLDVESRLRMRRH